MFGWQAGVTDGIATTVVSIALAHSGRSAFIPSGVLQITISPASLCVCDDTVNWHLSIVLP